MRVGLTSVRGRVAAVGVGGVLFAVYAATASRGVTFWDAGEFISAFATLGVPHPPGTPLFVCLGRAWSLLLGLFGVGVAHAAGLFSAACTAAAGGVTALLLTRWTRSALGGVGGALCAGGMSTAWSSATEAEVYGPALLLSLLAVLAADSAGRPRAPERDQSAAFVASAYALALSVPIYLGALAAAPVATWLAASRVSGRLGSFRDAVHALDRRRVAAMVGGSLICVGVGSGRAALVVAGLGALVAAAGWPGAGTPNARREVVGATFATAVALSAVLILLVRARHDPWLNQADPSTWGALGDAVARRQYAPAPPWPRQAPLWLQLGNLFEWADWQSALGLAPGVAPSWRRTPVTLAYAALGLVGARWHSRRDRRSAAAWGLLLACGTVGVALYLNLKAGPSYGRGVIPDDAPREARERDYFFALGWWAWGAWAGLGAAVAARRLARAARSLGRTFGARARRPAGAAVALGVAALPIVLSWGAADRRREPSASTPGVYARAVLGAAPPAAVLLVAADNDTYPLWAAQSADGVRRDVTPVTLSLLPARWYRAELARRHGLLPPAAVDRWIGLSGTSWAIGVEATRRGRPLVATLAVDPAVHQAVGGAWVHSGLLVAHTSGGATRVAGFAPASPELAAASGVERVDLAAVTRAATRIGRVDRGDDRGDDAPLDAVTRWAHRQLACPAAILDGTVTAPVTAAHTTAARVEGPCQAR